MLWHFSHPFDDEVHVVYNGHYVHPHLLPFIDVTLDPATGCSLLSISRVRISDAGTYSCLRSDTGHWKIYFEHVVFGLYKTLIALRWP